MNASTLVIRLLEGVSFRETTPEELERTGVVARFGDNAWGDCSVHGEPFIILRDGEPVGWFQLTGRNEINVIEVKPELQKQGIGTEVLRQLYGGEAPRSSTPMTAAGAALFRKFGA